MIKNSFLFFILLFSSGKIFSQELVPYYDREKQLWGFQNKETQQIIVQPKFEYAEEWWKEYGIVQDNGKYGLIDINGNKISPFIHEKIYVEKCIDCPNDNLLFAYRFYQESEFRERHFSINLKCDCVPKPYFPCPPMVKMDTSETPINLKLLQQAEKYYHLGEIKTALEKADLAIAADTNDASTYFWKAIHLSDMHELIIMEDPEIQIYYLDIKKRQWENENIAIEKILENRLNSRQSDKISEEEYQTEIAKLNEEKRIFEENHQTTMKLLDSLGQYHSKWSEGLLDYMNTKSDTSFHLKYYFDQTLAKTKSNDVYHSSLAGKYGLKYISDEERNKIRKEIKKEVPRFQRKSEEAIILHPGFGFFPYSRVEMNASYGFSEFVFKKSFPLMAGLGVGYDRDLNSEMESYKALILIQPLGVIHAALNFMYVKDANSDGFGFRPEFGFSFSAFTVLYGYNIVSKSKFENANGNMVSIRLNLPIWRRNHFQKDFGNNLYRN